MKILWKGIGGILLLGPILSGLIVWGMMVGPWWGPLAVVTGSLLVLLGMLVGLRLLVGD